MTQVQCPLCGYDNSQQAQIQGVGILEEEIIMSSWVSGNTDPY
jgi:hypothetical protein